MYQRSRKWIQSPRNFFWEFICHFINRHFRNLFFWFFSVPPKIVISQMTKIANCLLDIFVCTKTIISSQILIATYYKLNTTILSLLRSMKMHLSTIFFLNYYLTMSQMLFNTWCYNHNVSTARYRYQKSIN